MNKNIALAVYFMAISLCAALFVNAAETTETLDTGPMEGETLRDSPAGTCALRVEKSYNIRSDHMVATGNKCNVFRSTSERSFGSYDITVLGTYGYESEWVKFKSDETKDCPGGTGWAFYKAFNQEDFAAFRNGECGTAAYPGRGSRNPPDSTPEGTVVAKNDRGHRFPLDNCMGLKNDGGLGHYGAPRQGHTHGGTDYYSPAGTPIHSPCDGNVITSKTGNVAGNMIVIRCTNGDEFKMMHMHSSPYKHGVGKVTKGKVVGGVGKTGNARGQAPHLHLEAVIKGRRVDPQTLWSCGGDSKH